MNVELLRQLRQRAIALDGVRWSRLFEQFFRVDKWNLCRG
jgi:hypothetical protein